MPNTVNGAGGSAADPVLKGLGVDVVLYPSSADVSTFNDAFIDAATGFPGTNSFKSNVSPTSSTIIAGTTGSYNDTNKRYTITSTTGLAAGDYVFLSHASLTDGEYRIASVVDGTNITLDSNPLDGSGNQTNTTYQVGWVYNTDTGTSPFLSDASGDQNFIKFDAEDAGTNNTQVEQSLYVRDAPSGSSYIELEGGSYTGQSAGDFALTLAILSAWANNGGITHVELDDHSVQSVNNFTWTSGGGTGEVTLATAEAGLTASAGDGNKYGRLLLKSKAGSSTTVAVDIDINVDSSGPTLSISLHGA